MPSEGVKTLRFAARINAIQHTTIVGLVTSGGTVRAEYISGSEDKISGDWVYNFLILEEDIPTGLTFDAITESIFVAPYITVWATAETCDEYCYPITATETIIELPDYITGLDVQSALVDGVTQVCEVKITASEFGTLITQILDLDFLATYICDICECGALIVADEGVSTTDPTTTIDFVGAGVTVTDAGGGTATVTIPGGSGIVAYGGIKGTAESTATNIAAATWEPLIECWDSNMPFENMTPDQANGLITIDATGDYLINASVTFSPGTADATYSFDIYVDGVTANLRAESTVGDLQRQCINITGILSLIPTESVQIYVTSDAGVDTVTARQAQLNIHYLGETTGG